MPVNFTARRPLSIWILCLLNGLLAIVLVAVAVLARSRGYSGIQAIAAVVAGVGISIGAHATWYGARWGRLLLLVLLAGFLGLVIAHSVMVIAWARDTGYHGEYVTYAWIRGGASLAWLALNAIVLFGRRARMFFG